MDALGLGLNYFEEPWLRKAGSENATEKKMGSDSEWTGLTEKALHHL